MEVGGFDLICFSFFCCFPIYCMMHINKPIVFPLFSFSFFYLFLFSESYPWPVWSRLITLFFKTFPFILAFCKLSHDRLIFKFTFGWWNLILEPIGSRPHKGATEPSTL